MLRFRLGYLSMGSLYMFSEMGEFRTHHDAVSAFDSLPRNGRQLTVTVETVPRVKHGIEYGHDYVVRTLHGTVVS